MAAQWPLITQRLLAMLPTLPGWGGVTVFDGPMLSDDITVTYATVGYVSDDHAGAYTQTRAPDGFRWTEQGEVRCELVCMDPDGGVDLPGVRSKSFSLADAFEVAVRADERLGGVLSVDSQVDLSVDVRSQQTSVGAFQSLVLTLSYLTVT